MRQSDQKRLEFAGSGAFIQQRLSHLLFLATGLFSEVYDTGEWPTDGGMEATGWAAEGKELADAWRALRPPAELQPLWQEVGVQIDGLVALLNEIPPLESSDLESRPEHVRVLQGRFNAHLAVMTKAEAQLLAEENRLRANASGGSAA